MTPFAADDARLAGMHGYEPATVVIVGPPAEADTPRRVINWIETGDPHRGVTPPSPDA